MAACTPYCPGVSGFPELECNGCQTLFHSKCVGISPNVVDKIKATFKCKVRETVFSFFCARCLPSRHFLFFLFLFSGVYSEPQEPSAASSGH